MNIVREELNKIGDSEVLFPIMQNNDAKLETSLVLGIMAASLFKRTVSRDLQYIHCVQFQIKINIMLLLIWRKRFKKNQHRKASHKVLPFDVFKLQIF